MSAKPLVDVLEDEWDAQLFRGPKALANVLSWTTYHTLRSRGSRSGYPDRTCVRERILFVELKREKTKPTPDQIAWLDKLAAAGGETYLWRPSDLEETGLILARRQEYIAMNGELLCEGESFRPRSLWIAGHGRRDA